jgi:hypothetical protein
MGRVIMEFGFYGATFTEVSQDFARAVNFQGKKEASGETCFGVEAIQAVRTGPALPAATCHTGHRVRADLLKGSYH